jgi:hypothetical protein
MFCFADSARRGPWTEGSSAPCARGRLVAPWRLLVVISALVAGFAVTTTASAATFIYDAPATRRVDVAAAKADEADATKLVIAPKWTASSPIDARGTSTTPTLTFVATEAAGSAGYSASKINITDDGLAHVFDRHLADGSLSAGKSLFYDNVTLTRLIADAGDAVVPITQRNGNLAYVVDAGRNIGVDRATGLPTSTYTVITKPSGDLVTAFPGSP